MCYFWLKTFAGVMKTSLFQAVDVNCSKNAVCWCQPVKKWSLLTSTTPQIAVCEWQPAIKCKFFCWRWQTALFRAEDINLECWSLHLSWSAPSCAFYHAPKNPKQTILFWWNDWCHTTLNAGNPDWSIIFKTTVRWFSMWNEMDKKLRIEFAPEQCFFNT